MLPCPFRVLCANGHPGQSANWSCGVQVVQHVLDAGLVGVWLSWCNELSPCDQEHRSVRCVEADREFVYLI